MIINDSVGLDIHPPMDTRSFILRTDSMNCQFIGNGHNNIEKQAADLQMTSKFMPLNIYWTHRVSFIWISQCLAIWTWMTPNDFWITFKMLSRDVHYIYRVSSDSINV